MSCPRQIFIDVLANCAIRCSWVITFEHWLSRLLPLGTPSLNLQKTQWEKGRKSNDFKFCIRARDYDVFLVRVFRFRNLYRLCLAWELFVQSGRGICSRQRIESVRFCVDICRLRLPWSIHHIEGALHHVHRRFKSVFVPVILFRSYIRTTWLFNLFGLGLYQSQEFVGDVLQSIFCR